MRSKRKPPSRSVPADLSRLKRYDVSRRRSLVRKDQFATAPARRDTIARFLDKLPRILKSADWTQLLDHIAEAKRRGKPVFWLLGAHVIKCGLSPVILDLMRYGLVDLIALNGAGAIHDLEIAFIGQTSEDVAAGLKTGQFGMARDTARWFAGGVDRAKQNQLGLGEGLGRFIRAEKPRWRRFSLLAAAAEWDIPALVFPAIGAEIVAQHPEFDGAAVGEAGHIDFRLLATECRKLHRGGVVLQFGSAVILPEVFLKALSVARNQRRVEGIVTANFDMIQHYRPLTNLVSRPTSGSGHGYSFTGHHELMLPFLAWSLKSRLKL
ncbi:MAG TPA: hypothetical protein VGB22_05130 [candidate division Zixibacteria bacterium]